MLRAGEQGCPDDLPDIEGASPSSTVAPSTAMSFKCTSANRSRLSFSERMGSRPALASQYTSSSSFTSRGSVSVIINRKGVVPPASGTNSKS